MQEYLAFVDEIGRTSQGDYIYRFDFTTNTDVVWGDYFNIAPAVMVPHMEPDINCLSSSAKVNIPNKLTPACKNACFSLQDCIDGIIPIVFSEIDTDYTLSNDNEIFHIMFGETYENVIEYLSKFNLSFYEHADVDNGDTSAIDDIINNNSEDNEF